MYEIDYETDELIISKCVKIKLEEDIMKATRILKNKGYKVTLTPNDNVMWIENKQAKEVE